MHRFPTPASTTCLARVVSAHRREQGDHSALQAANAFDYTMPTAMRVFHVLVVLTAQALLGAATVKCVATLPRPCWLAPHRTVLAHLTCGVWQATRTIVALQALIWRIRTKTSPHNQRGTRFTPFPARPHPTAHAHATTGIARAPSLPHPPCCSTTLRHTHASSLPKTCRAGRAAPAAPRRPPSPSGRWWALGRHTNRLTCAGRVLTCADRVLTAC